MLGYLSTGRGTITCSNSNSNLAKICIPHDVNEGLRNKYVLMQPTQTTALLEQLR